MKLNLSSELQKEINIRSQHTEVNFKDHLKSIIDPIPIALQDKTVIANTTFTIYPSEEVNAIVRLDQNNNPQIIFNSRLIEFLTWVNLKMIEGFMIMFPQDKGGEIHTAHGFENMQQRQNTFELFMYLLDPDLNLNTNPSTVNMDIKNTLTNIIDPIGLSSTLFCHQFQFILLHEIGHLAKGHLSKGKVIDTQILWNKGVRKQIESLTYRPEDELEADEFALHSLRRLFTKENNHTHLCEASIFLLFIYFEFFNFINAAITRGIPIAKPQHFFYEYYPGPLTHPQPRIRLKHMNSSDGLKLVSYDYPDKKFLELTAYEFIKAIDQYLASVRLDMINGRINCTLLKRLIRYRMQCFIKNEIIKTFESKGDWEASDMAKQKILIQANEPIDIMLEGQMLDRLLWDETAINPLLPEKEFKNGEIGTSWRWNPHL